MFILGDLWFTLLFGKAYCRELGVSEPGEEGSSPPGRAFGLALAGQFIASLAIATVLAWLIGNSSVLHGALIGLAGGALLAAALTQPYQFEGKNLRNLFINLGYMVVGITAVGAIRGAFQAR